MLTQKSRPGSLFSLDKQLSKEKVRNAVFYKTLFLIKKSYKRIKEFIYFLLVTGPGSIFSLEKKICGSDQNREERRKSDFSLSVDIKYEIEK